MPKGAYQIKNNKKNIVGLFHCKACAVRLTCKTNPYMNTNDDDVYLVHVFVDLFLLIAHPLKVFIMHCFYVSD